MKALTHLILPRSSGGGGPPEGRWRGSSAQEKPLHHASHGPPPLQLQGRNWSVLATTTLLLTACATQATTVVTPTAPGFLLGVWHGFIFPVAWVLSLFMPDVAIYAVPNNGGWYDFGYFLGIAVFGVGARKSHVVYRDRVIREQVVEGSHRVRREDEL